jgi:hypothetical protein
MNPASSDSPNSADSGVTTSKVREIRIMGFDALKLSCGKDCGGFYFMGRQDKSFARRNRKVLAVDQFGVALATLNRTVKLHDWLRGITGNVV